jgi:GrpB-like predicted nucleotidyltransferase (UPF0157 family)
MCCNDTLYHTIRITYVLADVPAKTWGLDQVSGDSVPVRSAVAPVEWDYSAMPKKTNLRAKRLALTEEHIRTHTIGTLEPLQGRIVIVDYDPQWPKDFEREADRIRVALGSRAFQIEHTGSTSVPGLAAKPIIDMLLVVADSADEASYLPALESSGCVLRIREADWHEHRMFWGPDTKINLHVFSSGCPEIERMLLFRDWLRNNAADRELYARTKLALVQQEWKHIQNYADAKTAVIEEIIARARVARENV